MHEKITEGITILPLQNSKSERLGFEKKPLEHHVPEWWQPREIAGIGF